jgi:hypothetical protein
VHAGIFPDSVAFRAKRKVKQKFAFGVDNEKKWWAVSAHIIALSEEYFASPAPS